jgi:hypothetical protein
MRYLYRAVLGLATLSGLALVLGFVGPVYYGTKAELVQRVKPHDEAMAELTGEVGTLIGPPEKMIIADPKAFVEGTGDGGARLANEDYMQSHRVYPLQLKSVEAVSNYVRLASGGALVLLGVAAFALRRKLA